MSYISELVKKDQQIAICNAKVLTLEDRMTCLGRLRVIQLGNVGRCWKKLRRGEKMKQIEPNDLCEINGCVNFATDLVAIKKNSEVMKLCGVHSIIAQDIEKPEYNVGCLNCGCINPVN